MDWTEVVRREHNAAQQQLAQAVNAATISVPIGDSDATAPGYLCEGLFFSCAPDPSYPWNPAVLRAVREEICADAMPITVRSVWRWSNYHELGRIDEPMVLVRHGMARAVRGLKPLDYFDCTMPSVPVPGLRIPGRAMIDCVPNQLWDSWADHDDRPYGPDLPGAYLPMDWDYFRALKRGEDRRVQVLRAGARHEDAAGNLVAAGGAKALIDPLRTDHLARRASRLDDRRYINRDIDRYHSIEPSDVEWKEASLGPRRKPSRTFKGDEA